MSLAELSDIPGKLESLFVSAEYLPDPLLAYRALCQGRPHNLLLESAEIDSKDNLKSLILVDSALKLVCNGNQVNCEALSDNGKVLLPLIEQAIPQGTEISREDHQLQLTFAAPDANLDEDSRLKAPAVFDALRILQQQITPLRDHPHALFLGGAFAYDLLASFEQLPAVPPGCNTCPDYVFYVAETLILIDHQQQSTEIIGSVFSGEGVANRYFALNQRIEQLRQSLAQSHQPDDGASVTLTANDLAVDKDDTTYKQDVLQLKENILAGDIFQVVPSRAFSLPCPNPYRAYEHLKQQNPSPYMFYLQGPDFSMFGASPESALKYHTDDNQVEVYPIAGTRPRGKHADGSINPDLDSRIELTLREDQKEKAEHLMLVDLARNDIARVSQPGTRHVKALLQVDRYSHVMHLVSRVVGQLREDLDALHAYQACMNMGTLVGAPKVRAAELIRHTEQQRRGSYGGAVGYINGHGDMDTCIVIRSAFVQQGTAYIQAGAGVVYDSDPQSEADETRGKAQAVINAVLSAHQGQETSA